MFLLHSVIKNPYSWIKEKKIIMSSKSFRHVSAITHFTHLRNFCLKSWKPYLNAPDVFDLKLIMY